MTPLLAHHQLILGIPFALPAVLIFAVLGWLKLRDRLRKAGGPGGGSPPADH